MSTAIEPEAIEKYAEKVFWKIKVPKNTKASMIESYTVERESEAEMLIQRMSKLVIKDAKYDKINHKWHLEAELKQDNIVLGTFCKGGNKMEIQPIQPMLTRKSSFTNNIKRKFVLAGMFFLKLVIWQKIYSYQEKRIT